MVVLLRRNLRRIAVKNLTDMIFDRNKALKGQLKAIKCKQYGDDDVNQNGQSRKQWRLIHLEGDDTFMDSISAFPDDHRFQLGASGVQIRGGNRAASTRGANRRDRRNENKKTGLNPEAITHVLALTSDEVMAQEECRERNEFSNLVSDKNNNKP